MTTAAVMGARDRELTALAAERFDLVIVGGGVSGVEIGIALSVVSGLCYTAAWIRIYEARAPENAGISLTLKPDPRD
jgi:hypothetical protein